MTKRQVERALRARKGNKDSVNEQIAVTHAMWEQGVVPGIAGPKRKEVEARLGLRLCYKPKTVVEHLADAGLVEKYRKPGPERYIIATWRSEGIINGEIPTASRQAIHHLIEHIRTTDPSSTRGTATTDGGVGPLRTVLADEFDVSPDRVEDTLWNGDRVEKLNRAVEAITAAGLRTRGDYGQIIFRNKAFRYRLSAEAIRLYRK